MRGMNDEARFSRALCEERALRRRETVAPTKAALLFPLGRQRDLLGARYSRPARQLKRWEAKVKGRVCDFSRVRLLHDAFFSRRACFLCKLR